MLRIATLSAWAQLQTAAHKQDYLQAVIEPHREALAFLWVAALRDYASIHLGSEALHEPSTLNLDPSYSSLGKEVLLPVCVFYWSA
jgi:HEAT repeat-containing protein 5